MEVGAPVDGRLVPQLGDRAELLGDADVVDLHLQLFVEAVLKLGRDPGPFVRLTQVLAHLAPPDGLVAVGAAHHSDAGYLRAHQMRRAWTVSSADQMPARLKHATIRSTGGCLKARPQRLFLTVL